MIAVLTQERILPTRSRSECNCEQVSHRNYTSCSWRGGEFRLSLIFNMIQSLNKDPNRRFRLLTFDFVADESLEGAVPI